MTSGRSGFLGAEPAQFSHEQCLRRQAAFSSRIYENYVVHAYSDSSEKVGLQSRNRSSQITHDFSPNGS